VEEIREGEGRFENKAMVFLRRIMNAMLISFSIIVEPRKKTERSKSCVPTYVYGGLLEFDDDRAYP
jgi:hypothetical protein